MELKINAGVFFLLDAGSEKRLYDSESNAIKALKEVAAAGKDVNSEELNIMEIDTTGEKWAITSVPWSKIALGLIREG